MCRGLSPQSFTTHVSLSKHEFTLLFHESSSRTRRARLFPLPILTFLFRLSLPSIAHYVNHPAKPQSHIQTDNDIAK